MNKYNIGQEVFFVVFSEGIFKIKKLKISFIQLNPHEYLTYGGYICEGDEDIILLENEVKESIEECLAMLQLKINILKETHHVE